MGDRVAFALSDDGATLELTVADARLRGHAAVVTLAQRLAVRRSGGHGGRRTLVQRRFTLAASHRLPLPAEARGALVLTGRVVDIDLVATLKIDDGLVFDTSIEDTVAAPRRLPPLEAAADLPHIDPKDRFSLAANLKAIPYRNRVIAIVLAVAGLVVGGANALVGAHDQFVPASQQILYSHPDDDDESGPLMTALTGSGALGVGIWFALRRQLRRYMSFSLNAPKAIGRGTVVPASRLVAGVPRVALERVLVRVIAYNHEFGKATTGSGKERKTRTHVEPLRAVTLYEQFLEHAPAGVDIARSLEGEVAFEPVFDALYPPLEIDGDGGIRIGWEVQLLHEAFVDQEIEGPPAVFRLADFWNQHAAPEAPGWRV